MTQSSKKHQLGWKDATMSETGAPIALADLQGFEQLVGCRLPASYAEFLLKYNGGRPSNWCVVPIPAMDSSPEQDIQFFFGIGQGEEDLALQLHTMRSDHGRMDLVPIAITSGGRIYVILLRSNSNPIQLFDPWAPDTLVPVAGSFDELLGGIYKPDWWDDTNDQPNN